MKSIPLHQFVPKYPKLISDALKRKEEIVVTRRGIPYFIVTPVRPRVNYDPVKKNPAPGFVRVTKKYKGKKTFSVPYLIG